jgi:hypothetical protein
MSDKFYMVCLEGMKIQPYMYESMKEAEEKARILSKESGQDAFILESVTCVPHKEINERVDSFEKALKYLDIENGVGYLETGGKHRCVIQAMLKLITIAEAWNKADEFVPDFSNDDQKKYWPRFIYKHASKVFGCSSSNYRDFFFDTYFGSRLCFKTFNRARQFGRQFIDLWNEFLLINNN